MGHFRDFKTRVHEAGRPDGELHPEHLTEGVPKLNRTAEKAPAPQGKAAAKKNAEPVKAQFLADAASLKGLRPIEKKIELKRGFVNAYRDHVVGLLDNGVQDDTFAPWVVWLADVGLIEEFIPRAEQAAALGWKTGFEGTKDFRTFLFDAVRQWAEAEHAAGRSVEPYFGRVYARVGEMLDIQAAKFHKLQGILLMDRAGTDEDLKAAVEVLERAQAMEPKIGVKTRIEDMKKRLARETGKEGGGTEGSKDTGKAPPPG